MGLTPEQYLPMLARLDKNRVREVAADAVDDESELQGQISAECRSRGWFFVCSAMCRKTSIPIGTTDFVIAADHGRTLWVEAKSKTGKVKPAQAAVAAMLRKNAHEYALVRSFSEFLQLINTNQP